VLAAEEVRLRFIMTVEQVVPVVVGPGQLVRSTMPTIGTYLVGTSGGSFEIEMKLASYVGGAND
jgi:hypothetical protein